VQKRNAGVSPLRRQKTPPSVEMTRSFVGVEENRQRQVQLQVPRLRISAKCASYFAQDDTVVVGWKRTGNGRKRRRQLQEETTAD
jgi:hypothetical protein